MGGEVLQDTKKKGNPTLPFHYFLFTQFQFFNNCTIALNIFFL
jgi:hypothetical protein